MVKVYLYGTARVQFKEKMIELDVKSVKELLEKVAERYNVKVKDVKQHLIFVNEVNILSLKRYRTELKDGDIVYLLSPASGG